MYTELPPIPIIPADGLYLYPNNHGDEKRFIRLFILAWRQLPYRDRRRLKEFWAPTGPSIGLRPMSSPLLSGMTDRELDRARRWPWAWKEFLAFPWTAAEGMSDTIMKDWIGVALAEVYLAALAKP